MINYNSKDWIVWEQNCAPFFLVMTLNPSMKELREYLGTSLFTTLIDFGYDNNGNYEGKWLLRFAEGNSLGQKMTDLLLCKAHRRYFDEAVELSATKLIDKANQVFNSNNLQELSMNDLIKLYKELQALFYNFYKYGAFVEPLQWYTETELNKYVLENKLDEKTFMKHIASLSKDSFTFVILQDFYGCVKKFKEVLLSNEKLSTIWKNRGNDSVEEIYKLIKESGTIECKQLFDTIKLFADKYYWKMNNYFSTYRYDIQDVIGEILKEPETKIEELGNTLKTKIETAQIEKRTNYANKIQLINSMPIYYKNIVELADLAAELSDMRKHIVMKSNASFDKILMIVSKRTGESLENLHLLLPQEIEHYIRNPKLFDNVFKDRKKAFLVIQSDFPMVDELINSFYKEIDCDADKVRVPIMNDPFIVAGDLVEKTLRQIDTKYNLLDHSSEKDIKISGTVTYKGENSKITGIAHIIKDPKQESVLDGEVLIAPSTTPDFITSIQACSAIVTDWGGQTSHAAIVSREFKKPCIIGTNFASQFISTGDIVELDFNTGIVTILKRGTNDAH